MTEDWDAVARAIAGRLAETQMTQMDVASRAKVSLTTVRELQHNINARRRRPQTLAAISTALGWPADYLGRVVSGDVGSQAHPSDDVSRELDAIRAELAALRDRVGALEDRCRSS